MAVQIIIILKKQLFKTVPFQHAFRLLFWAAFLAPSFLFSDTLRRCFSHICTFVRMEKNLVRQLNQTLQPRNVSPLCCLKASAITWDGGLLIGTTSPFFAYSFQKPLHSWQAVLPYGLAGSRLGDGRNDSGGDHLNTRVFLVAFQLCIWDRCNQVGNNSVDKTDCCDGKADIICIFRNSHNEFYLCIQLCIFTLQKLFFFSWLLWERS